MLIAREGIHGRFLSPIASLPALDDRNEGATASVAIGNDKIGEIAQAMTSLPGSIYLPRGCIRFLETGAQAIDIEIRWSEWTFTAKENDHETAY
jgi:hypothetical protein